jgi:hypothetical protein
MARAVLYLHFLTSVFFAALAAAVSPAVAEAPAKRVALVIGNSAYQHAGHLPNPKNDATDVAAALEQMGFLVILGTDLDKVNMERTIRRFAQAAKGAQVGLLFYAGHGIQVAGQNYLVPIDAKLDDASGLDFELVRADLVQRTMEREAVTNLLFLDACRDNPLARNLARAMGTRSASIGRGLAVVESGIGTLISFSTQPGNVALDGDGRNSPYTGALVRNLGRGGQDISSLLIGVRREVMASTNNQQVPWEHSALTERFYFAGPESSAPPAAAAPAPILMQPPPSSMTPSYEQQAELALWATVKDSRNPDLYRSYLERFPQGVFAPAARILLEQTRRETGVQAGGTAVAKAPVEEPTVPARPAGEPVVDPARLTHEIQAELVRLGCLAGKQDGQWGTKSRSALSEFARRTNIALQTDGPSTAALEAARKHTQRVCPLECDDGEFERDGKCVARPAAPAQRRETRSDSRARRDTGSKPDNAPKPSGGGTCWSNEIKGSQLVPCSDPRSNGRRAY